MQFLDYMTWPQAWVNRIQTPCTVLRLTLGELRRAVTQRGQWVRPGTRAFALGMMEACQSPALTWTRWRKMARLEVVVMVEEGLYTKQRTEAWKVDESLSKFGEVQKLGPKQTKAKLKKASQGRLCLHGCWKERRNLQVDKLERGERSWGWQCEVGNKQFSDWANCICKGTGCERRSSV